jgi:predicted MFS family arabinose efflux permease
MGGLIGTLCIGYVIDRVKKPALVMIFILSILLLSIASIPVLRWFPLFGILPFLSWGAMGWASVTPQQLALIRIKPDCEAVLIALNSSAISMGSVFGTALWGAMLTVGLNAEQLPYITATMLIFALLWQWSLFRKSQKISADA